MSAAGIDAELVYTPEQVAKHWSTSVDTVRRMLRLGQLRAFKVGDGWRVTGRALLEHEGVLPRFANGGFVRPGRPTIVGECGPEEVAS